jgi:hypothetical protein
MVTALALEIAPVGYTANHDRGSRQSPVASFLPYLSCMILMIHCLYPETTLLQVRQVHLYGIIKEISQIILELFQKIFFCWHGFKSLYKIIPDKSFPQGQIGKTSCIIGKSALIN